MKKQNEENIPNVKKEGWEAEELSEEAANQDSDDIVGQMKKGEGSDKDVPDKLKVAPTDDSDDSLHGRGTYDNKDEEE